MRLYPESIIKANGNKTLNEVLSKLNSIYRRLCDTNSEKEIIEFHDCIRILLGLPNKLFCFASNADHTETVLFIFDKEPDGNHHKIFKDEYNDPYLIIEDEEEDE